MTVESPWQILLVLGKKPALFLGADYSFDSLLQFMTGFHVGFHRSYYGQFEEYKEFIKYFKEDRKLNFEEFFQRFDEFLLETRGKTLEQMAEEPTQSESKISDRAPEPVGAFPHAKRVGNLLFLSGIGPRKRGTKTIPGVTLDGEGRIVAYDIAEQCRSVFENVRTVLEDAGSSWENIVDVTTFLTNMKDDFATYNKIYAEWFAGEGKPNPARTTLEINCLPTPIAIELKVIATI